MGNSIDCKTYWSKSEKLEFRNIFFNCVGYCVRLATVSHFMKFMKMDEIDNCIESAPIRPSLKIHSDF